MSCFVNGCQSRSQLPPAAIAEVATTSTNALVNSCLICHGTREMQRGPVLDGLPAWYLELQLRKFLAGVRGCNPENRSEHLMGSGISLLRTEADFEVAVKLFSEKPPQDHLKTIRGDVGRGRQLFTYCATCHGFDGRGREEVKAPPLTVQEDWYLYDQLVRFKAGLRGGTAADPEGFLMHQAVLGLNTQDFRDVVSYVNDELAGRSSGRNDR
ncbi:MAG TPA: hypothetical protein DCY13_11505 [Verrucomicrobiales bacterium]|nr:hypothetical protein [Verrucomicrobiales bacterium]